MTAPGIPLRIQQAVTETCPGLTEGLLGGVFVWAQTTLGPYGIWGVVLLAFTESIINPVPPDVLLPVLAIGSSTGTALLLGLVTAAASVAGAAVGYWIGKTFSPWVHRRFHGPRLERVEDWYNAHGEWIVLLAAFTPIPFKVFTVTSGLAGLRFWPFLLAAAVGRSLRFVPEAVLSAWYGCDVIGWIDRGGWIVLGLAGLAVGGYWLYKQRTRATA